MRDRFDTFDDDDDDGDNDDEVEEVKGDVICTWISVSPRAVPCRNMAAAAWVFE